MKKFLLKLALYNVVVEAETKKQLETDLAARGIAGEVVQELSDEETKSVVAVTVEDLPEELTRESKPSVNGAAKVKTAKVKTAKKAK